MYLGKVQLNTLYLSSISGTKHNKPEATPYPYGDGTTVRTIKHPYPHIQFSIISLNLIVPSAILSFSF